MRIFEILKKCGSFLPAHAAVFVIGAACAAYVFPSAFRWVKGDAQSIVLAIIMLSMGMTLGAEDFKALARRPFSIFLGAVAQYTLMPLGAYAIVRLCHLPDAVAVGLLLVGTCPGGVSSNLMSYLARGDVAYSVGMTTVSTLLSPIITPLLMLWLAGEAIEVDGVGLFRSILLVTLFPVCGGMALNRLFGGTRAYRASLAAMPAVAVCALACIVGGVTAWHGDRFAESGLVIFAAIAAHNALGYLGGFFTAKLFKMGTAQARTLSIEVGCQNAGLATNLATRHFAAHPEAAVAAAVACVYHSLSGTLLANAFALWDAYKKKRALGKERFFTLRRG